MILITIEISMERIMIFIDNSNIFKGFRKYKVKIDYEKLKQTITAQRSLEGILLYEGIFYPISNAKKKWYNDLRNNSGYEIVTSFDKRVEGNAIEKKIDVKLAIDVVSYAYEDKYDTAVLVSGDGDFVPVLEKIKSLGKNVEVWAFKYSLAKALQEEVTKDRMYYMDKILNKIKM